ncbi:MAG: copper homeostasis protein CutC [Bacteroidota bacterium]
MVSLEVCANSAISAIAAQAGGAIRVELCNNLHQGGTTPSHGHIIVARKELHIKLYMLIRPRSGDFLYNKNEFEVMLSDVRHSIEYGCDGIVFGILNKDGTVDMERNMQIANMARQHGLGATFHRAFDVCADKDKALEDIIELGFERILTSGGKSSAMEGASNIKHLIDKAANRIMIMPGGGINESNLGNLVRFTGVTEFHSSARSVVHSNMVYRNENIMMGSRFVDEYATYETDSELVNKLIRIANP